LTVSNAHTECGQHVDVVNGAAAGGQVDIWYRPVLGWVSLGGELLGGAGAVLQTGGRLVVFARGTDNAIWHRWQTSRNGEWSDWVSLGGELTSDPDAALNADGGLVVFARGTDNAIWHRWQSAPDSEWA